MRFIYCAIQGGRHELGYSRSGLVNYSQGKYLVRARALLPPRLLLSPKQADVATLADENE